MNIDGLNSTKKLKVSNPSLKNNSKHSNPAFKGHVLTQDNRGKDVYKFNLPNAPAGSKLYLALMTKDKDGYYKVSQKFDKNKDVYNLPQGYSSVYVYASDYGLDENNLLGYKFEVNGKEYTDKGAKGDENFTLTIPVTNSNVARPRQMEHVLVDAFNVKDPKNSAKRNHFNLLGGTLSSVYDKIPELAAFGIRNILGTPIFGQDNKSSHGYWTANAYQITNNLGTYKDFNKLITGLYQVGINWTADGAFVNEGIEGIHIKDILNWGVKSPFLAMFETKELENVPVRFGILSKNDDVNEHVHIKLVNAPYKIIFEKTENGYREKEIVSNSFDPTKATYIQVFDDRLASEKQINGDETFDVYENKEAKDRYEIASSKDSVQAYKFRVTPTAVKDNYKKYKENLKIDKNTEFKNLLTQWPEFSIVKSNKDGGISLWVGNSDISKKRFVLPEYTLKTMKLSPEKKKEVIAAQYQVQDDTVQIGKYWTSNVASSLTEYTAKELAKRVNASKKPVKEAYAEAIDSMVADKLLHEDAKQVYEKDAPDKPSALDNILTVSPVNGRRKYSLKPVKMPENITDGVMSYPFDSIEFSPDLLGIFAYPYLKNLAVTEETVGMSRYEMFRQGDSYYDLMPAAYQKTYKKMDEFLANDMTQKAFDIMKKLEEKTGAIYFEGEELTQEGREIYSLVAADITKFLIVSSLAPEIKIQDNPNILEYDIKELNKIDINKLNLQYEVSPEDTAKELISKLKKGLKNIPENNEKDLINNLYGRIKNINSDAVNVAKLIIEKTQSGLDWRIDASKDVGDFEAKEAGRFDGDKNEESIVKFWNKFNSGITLYNPKKVVTGELTDEPFVKPVFISKTKFETMSDYEFFYSTLPALFAQDDKGHHDGDFASQFLNQLEGFLNSGTIDNLNNAHRFVGNQDKPRILHLLATNVFDFNRDKGKEVKRVVENGFASTDEFKELSENNRKAITNALEKLQKGFHTVDGVKKEFDAENFGVRPFDYTIEDAINEACVDSKEFSDYVKNNPEKIKKLKAHTLRAILKPAMSKYRSILFTMVGLPGNPTNYAGDELGMTGWETFCKNEKQENRNALRWDWLSDDDYKFISEYRNTLADVMNIRNNKGASALVNGTTQPLHNQNIKGGGQAVALYRYNDKTDAIVVLHGKGYGGVPEHKGLDAHLSGIKLGGLVSGLQEGTIYVDALDKNKKYKVTSPYEIKKLASDGKSTTDDIDLGNVGLILLRQNDFSGKEIAFKGRMENPHVKLANTKYNFHYMTK